MNHRIYLLLEAQLQELKENKYMGIDAFPISEDLMEWEAIIEGLQDSMWQGLVFPLTIYFTPEYNFVPPTVKFRTIPFHPNVDPCSGQPCIELLDNPDKWDTSYTLSSILLSLQVMLSNPGLEQPVNLEAAQMLIKDESMYRTILQRLFHKPLEPKGDNLEPPQYTPKLTRTIRAISFYEYHKTWSGIATSKTSAFYRTPLLEDTSFIGQYYKWKKRELQYPEEWKFKYAAIKARLARENKMTELVSASKKRPHLPTPDDTYSESQSSSDSVAETSSFDSDTEEEWEEEVEDLVAWTHTLNAEALEEQT
ncbi:ubiquitin-conjugating enzyme E2 U [Ochotona curzoniae]|uniref:ubiquitin-conjugating enzyme E2 U n=1 Tax=Ochotona curzoniae TaxID=130825 RepID=UPI001B34F273|nr:ubiquitin-conjugating enzyme E2 U [Ochotona curzoniae]